MFNFMGLINGTAAIQTNVSCTCNCKRSTSFQSMEITQLEFVQILVIVVVMMVMVVVITCLLNHYRLSARSFISRHSQARRRHLPLASQQVYTPRPPDRGPSYLQRERLARFQPTYPYLPHAIIDLPPTISLSDGEEPPPYQGPCTLQLRDPEQQLELNRESVRAPPNRTVYDSHLLDTSLCPPPSLNAGISATTVATSAQAYSSRVEGAPPTYSEVIGHYYHPSSLPRHHHQTSSGSGGMGGGGGLGSPGPSLLHGILQQAHLGSLESRNACNKKEKQKPRVGTLHHPLSPSEMSSYCSREMPVSNDGDPHRPSSCCHWLGVGPLGNVQCLCVPTCDDRLGSVCAVSLPRLALD
ncbi:protein TMEPAI isoform X3 [Salmo salar]|uniref:Protein TMEPAI isoform X3 n=1 Tax=Salmo salar TaxID=8030 RepID=A0A1S3L883_SALSA|nr:protein TMEPAI isoform X3 [Salmo salar]|eukprot:XP_013987168.1 PREDICTED: protein TMEPAI isoform X3 [Salmo salar]